MKAKCANPAEFAIGCNSILLCETAKSVLFPSSSGWPLEATAVVSPSSRVYLDPVRDVSGRGSFHRHEILKTSTDPFVLGKMAEMNHYLLPNTEVNKTG